MGLNRGHTVCLVLCTLLQGVCAITPLPETPDPAATQRGTTQPQPDAAQQRAETEKLNKELAAIDERVGKIVSLRGKFVQKKQTPLLKKPLVSRGTFAIKGSQTLWETSEPRRSLMAIDEGSLRLFYPEQRTVEIYELGGDVREFSGSPVPRIEALRQSFEIKRDVVAQEGIENPTSTHLNLVLTPIREDLKQHVAQVRVTIDTSVPVLRRMEIEDADGERTIIEFDDVRVNIEIDDKDVRLALPEGTREVRPLGAGKNKEAPREDGK